MTAKEFVALLEEIAPTREERMAEGYSSALALEEISTYFPIRVREEAPFPDELVNLCFQYQFSQGYFPLDMQFRPPIETPLFWEVGKQDGERLVVDRQTSRVTVEEELGTARRWVLWHCAASGSQFLDAYGEALRLPPAETKDAYLASAKRCAQLAGGDAFLEFYEALLYRSERVNEQVKPAPTFWRDIIHKLLSPRWHRKN